MNHILVEDNRDMSMPSDMSLFLYIWISENGVYSVLTVSYTHLTLPTKA